MQGHGKLEPISSRGGGCIPWAGSYRYHQQLLNVKLHLSDDVVFTMQAKQWVWDFVELGDEMQGYQRICVTPYMHCMTFHVPQHLARLSKLTCTCYTSQCRHCFSHYVQTSTQNHVIERIWLEVNQRVTYCSKATKWLFRYNLNWRCGLCTCYFLLFVQMHLWLYTFLLSESR